MKTFIIGLLFGVIIGIGVFWYLNAGQSSPTVQQTEQRVNAQVEKAHEAAQAAGEQARQTLKAKLEALELRAEDIQEELTEHGRVVRRKARDIGEVAVDAAHDTHITAKIKAKLAADRDLSALSISVSTTAGLVTLSGSVASPEHIGKAMALALETKGVREVVSTIQVE